MALIDNLVHYYKFDESSGNASDSVGTATLTNTNTATYEAGKINNATKLVRASNQYFENTAAAIVADVNFSISVWVKPATSPASGQQYDIFSDNRTGGAAARVLLEYSYNGTNYQIVTDAVSNSPYQDNNIVYNLAGALSTSSFTHIVWTVASGGNQTLYIGGSSVTTVAQPASVLAGWASPNRVGESGYTTGRQFNGDIDELGIWSRELTSTEVTSLYNSGNGWQYPFSTGPANLKTVNGLAKASVKTINGLAIASVKSFNGLT